MSGELESQARRRRRRGRSRSRKCSPITQERLQSISGEHEVRAVFKYIGRGSSPVSNTRSGARRNARIRDNKSVHFCERARIRPSEIWDKKSVWRRGGLCCSPAEVEIWGEIIITAAVASREPLHERRRERVVEAQWRAAYERTTIYRISRCCI